MGVNIKFLLTCLIFFLHRLQALIEALGILFLNKGFTLRRAYDLPKLEGYLPSAISLGLLLVLTLGAGFKGGEIVPCFFVGATFGCTVAPLLGLSPSFGGAVGVVAAFCGVTNCPLSSILLAYELFTSRGLPLYALCCAISYMLSGYYGLYSEQKIIYSKFKATWVDRKAE